LYITGSALPEGQESLYLLSLSGRRLECKRQKSKLLFKVYHVLSHWKLGRELAACDRQSWNVIWHYNSQQIILQKP